MNPALLDMLWCRFGCGIHERTKVQWAHGKAAVNASTHLKYLALRAGYVPSQSLSSRWRRYTHPHDVISLHQFMNACTYRKRNFAQEAAAAASGASGTAQDPTESLQGAVHRESDPSLHLGTGCLKRGYSIDLVWLGKRRTFGDRG